MGASPYAVWGVVATASGTNATSIAVAGDNTSTGANAIGILGKKWLRPTVLHVMQFLRTVI